MRAADIRKFSRSPSGAVAIGLISALLLGSLATAGMNTLWVARVMIGASALISVAYILTSSVTSKWSVKAKVLTVGAALFIHIALERVETWTQPSPAKPRGMPVPPLLLMMPLTSPGYLHPEIKVPGIPLAVTYIQRPFGGYAAFGEVGDNENDDVMLGIKDIQMRNLSQKPLRLSWRLTIEGEGRRIELDGSGKGRWERQLNVNDFFAANRKPNLRPMSWQLSPLQLSPLARTSSVADIGFVAPNADSEVRHLILRSQLPLEYMATLAIKDEDTGVEARLKLPFGVPPVPANDPGSRMLREAIEGVSNDTE